MGSGRLWTREELLIARNVYGRLKFGQFVSRNPVIVDVAQRIARTPDALAMKLCQLASLDPLHAARGVGGLPNTSELDRAVWAEFVASPEALVVASEALLAERFGLHPGESLELLPREGVRRVSTSETTEAVAIVRRRLGQDFRDAVLNNFDGRCIVTGLSVRSLLVASHIRPWSDYAAERLDVRNGLAMNRLHDAAFDQFMIGFDDQLRLVVSPRLKQAADDPQVKAAFLDREGQPMLLPDEVTLPEPRFLAWHHSQVLAA